MAITKNAQQALYEVLSKFEVKVHQPPEYNGYTPNDFGFFMEKLQNLYAEFSNELNDNFTGSEPQKLKIYLIDILKTISRNFKIFTEYHREEIYQTLNENPQIFKQNQLGFINHFFNFQHDIFLKVITDIEQKLEIIQEHTMQVTASIGDDHSATPQKTETETQNHGTLPALSMKLKSGLNRKDLTVLWLMLGEAGFIKYDLQKNLADFLEQNFLYTETDKDKTFYKEISSIQSLISKLNDGITSRPGPSQDDLIVKLNEIHDIMGQQIKKLSNVMFSYYP